MPKRFKVLITVAITLALLSGSVSALNERADVTVIDNGVTSSYITYVKTAGEFFAEVGISIGPNDQVNYRQDEQLSTFARNTINIIRGISLEVVVSGVPRTIEVPIGLRVGHVIQMIKDETGLEYIYEGSLAEDVRPGQRIVLNASAAELINEYVPIPYDTETIYSDTILVGVIEVVNPGSDGLKQVTTRISLVNNVEVSREIVSEAISAPPITRVVHVGTGKPAEPEELIHVEGNPLIPMGVAATGNAQDATVVTASTDAFVEQAMSEWGLIPGGEEVAQDLQTQQAQPEEVTAEEIFDPDAPPKEYLKKLTMRASAYTSDYASTGKYPGHPQFGITSTGMKAGYGVVAVDPNVIELGTRLYIYGYGYCVAGDTGGAIIGDRIDLYLNTSSECLRYGIRTVEVYILD